jgi:hypothetical protein
VTWTCNLCPKSGTNLADWLALDAHLRTAHPSVAGSSGGRADATGPI